MVEAQQSIGGKGINIFLSFGAKTVQPEILESMLIGRQKTVDLLEQYAREIVNNKANHQVFIVGPRGSGKTHLLRVLFHRITDMVQGGNLVVAYFAEEEYGISGYLDYLIRIINSFMRWYDSDRQILENQLNLLRDTPEKRQEYIAETIISDYIKDRPLLILSENFDGILEALGKKGQAKLRAWLYRNDRVSIIATSQAFSPDMNREDRPFYGFFSHIVLKKITLEESLQLLQTLAKLEQRTTLIDHLEGKGRAQVQAIHELVKGNHRLLVTFYEFLKADSLSELSVIFLKTMNDLKPYFETFIRFLPAQQQKILYYLALAKIPQKGTDIAKNCFIGTASLTKQLSELQRQNLIDTITDPTDKRNKYYDVSEPLLRIAIEIGEQREGVTALFIDFLALYYSSDELYIQKSHFESRYLIEEEPSTKQKMYYEKEAREKALQIKNSLDTNLKKQNNNQLGQISLNGNSGNKEGNNFFINKQYEQAIEAYSKILTVEPNDFDTWNNLGVAYCYVNQYELAINAYLKAIEIKPNDADVWNNIGNTYDNLNQYKLAIDALLKAIAIQPEHITAWHNLGVTYFNEGQYERAIDALEKVIFVQPDNIGAWNILGIAYGKMKRYEQAIEALQKNITSQKDNANAWYNLGLIYNNLDQYEQAIDAYQKVLSIEPNNFDAWHNLGATYSNGGEYIQAISAFEKANIIQPNDASTWNNLGITYGKLNQHKQSVEAFQKSIDNQLNNPNTWYNLGVALGKINEYDQAIAAFRRVISIESNYPKVWYNLGITYGNLRQYEQSAEAFIKSIDIDSSNANSWYNLGVTYNFNKQNEKAIYAFQKTVDLDPENLQALNNLGVIYNSIGRREESIQAISKAINYEPNDANFWNNLGITYSDMEQHEKAIEAFQKAADLEPNSIEGWNNLGLSYGAIDQHELAIEAYLKVLAIQSDNFDAWNNIGVTYCYMEQYKRAIDPYLKAITIKPDDTDVWNNLGSTYNSLGEYQLAIDAFQKVISIDSTYPYAFSGLVESITKYLQTQTVTQKDLARVESWLESQEREELRIITTYTNVYRRIVFDKDEKALMSLSKEQRLFFEHEILYKFSKEK